MLDSLLPRREVPPWDTLPWEPHLHLGIFIHRVRGLTPGLYLLERSAAVHERIRPALRDKFLWTRLPDCPEHLRLWCLAEADLQEVSRVASCQQEIASDGAFSLGMLAEFGDTIRQRDSAKDWQSLFQIARISVSFRGHSLVSTRDYLDGFLGSIEHRHWPCIWGHRKSVLELLNWNPWNADVRVFSHCFRCILNPERLSRSKFHDMLSNRHRRAKLLKKNIKTATE